MSFREAPIVQMARDGRMRLTHGPIDLIVTAEGPESAAKAALRRAHEVFEPVLHDLCAELPRLRAAHGPAPRGAVALRMQSATDLFAPAFVTPMAAVAGSVADHILAAMLVPGHGLARAHVNNGGDIALWTSAAPLRLAICEDPQSRAPGARASIAAGDGIGGVATSGWRGRSHSLGIADAVTVLARDAARADAAATLIANAVDLPGHPAIARQPASALAPDSDLGDRPVTTGVGALTAREARRALDAGRVLAEDYIRRGLIRAACLALAGERTALGTAIAKEEPAHA
ncbi:UPF0280 family protein [Salipiger abyssi]|uniref:UPF0280 family protein n=1 Tax=Salipiger abyssi TaxID=1250539 RepID=UPI001A8FD8C0|nr:UPF0280 family protein [Salipiger abyssi]MBN9887581.1 UPF0280 family protein [Salipiger abyssi]